MNAVMQEIKMAAREAPRVFFAPLVGAAKEMRRQVQLLTDARQDRGVAPTKRDSRSRSVR